MKVERAAPWMATIEFTLERIVQAEAWILELTDREGRRVDGFAERGNPEASFPGFRDTLDKLTVGDDVERMPFAWIDAVGTDRYGAADVTGPKSLLVFSCPLATGVILSGGIVLARDSLRYSAFGTEADFLSYLRNIAASVAREQKAVEERSAMHRLLTLQTTHCIVVNRAGRIVFSTGSSGADPGSARDLQERAVAKAKGMIGEILARYRSAPQPRSRPLCVATIDQGLQTPLPIYIVPLAVDDPCEDGDLVALLLPSPSEPPCDETLVAALSLTPTEARVVRHVMMGRKVRSIADAMSLTEQTVRTYLKRIYAKLEVSGQCELIAKVSGLAVPFASGRRNAFNAAVTLRAAPLVGHSG